MHDAPGPRVAAPGTGGKASRVLRALREDIVSGALTPGERLTEARLCERYGVSRVPVREALQTLAAEGLVQVRPHLGASVATVPADEADDLYAIRRTLEEITVARCARRVAAGDPGVVPVLRAVLGEGLAALAAGEVHRLPELNTRLHLTLAELSGSTALPGLLRQVADRIQWIYATNVSTEGRRSWSEHRGIVEAIADGDPGEATRLMAAHITNSRRGYLDHRPAPG